MRYLWLLAAPCLCSLTGCGHSAAGAPTKSVIEPTEVSIASPILRTIHYVVQQPGRVEPYEQTPIYTKIPGFVRSVRVDIGDRVKKGDVLVELDVPELIEAHRAKQALVQQAVLGVAQAERTIDVITSALATSEANVEVSKAAREKTEASWKYWESECARMGRLVKDKVVDNQSGDEVMNQCKSAAAANREAGARIHGAEAALREAHARLEKAKADLDSARNQLTVAQAEERESNAMLGYSRLTAPYDGVISDRRVHTGHFLNAAAGGTKGEPLLVVVRTDKVRVFVEVPEADAVRIAKGSLGRIRVQTLNDREFEGTVTGTSWSLDPTQRTLRTEIDFDNPARMLRPGMYVHSLIDLTLPDAWVIPASAILVRDESTFCYEMKDGKTHRLLARLGLRDGKFVELAKIQRPPLTPGDAPLWMDPTGKESIIVTKPGELIDNQPVRRARSGQLLNHPDAAKSTREG